MIRVTGESSNSSPFFAKFTVLSDSNLRAPVKFSPLGLACGCQLVLELMHVVPHVDLHAVLRARSRNIL